MGKVLGGEELRRLKRLLLLPLLLFSVSCGDEALSLFFDIPTPTQDELAAAEREKAAAETRAKAAAAAKTAVPEVAAGVPAPAEEGAERRPIEAVTVWEEAEKMLPKDGAEGVDWVAAIRQGIIRPRAAIGRRGNPEANFFKFDFYFIGPDPSLDVYFPHSAHTLWLTCESCHPKIFRSRHTRIAMDRVFEGAFCGVCHGTVAFALDNCTRCHTEMEN